MLFIYSMLGLLSFFVLYLLCAIMATNRALEDIVERYELLHQTHITNIRELQSRINTSEGVR